MAVRIMETDEEYLDRTDGTPEGNFARAGGYNRMANVAVADYNSRPMPEDWDGALRHQEEQQRVRMEQERNAALAQQISANRGVYDGYAQMGNTVAARQAQFVGNANAHLAASLRLAAENGGRLPQYAWQGLGGALGLDGKDTAIVGGGFDKKGGFMLAVARKNPQTGQVEQTPMSFTPQQQYSLMLSTPGIFSRQEVEGMRGQLIDNFHMHPDQVPQVPQGWGETGNVGVGNRTATGGTSVNPNWLFGPQRRSSISAFGSDGRGGFTQYESNEGTGYQLQSRDFGTRERTWDGMSERERIARINADSREKQAQTNADARIAAAEARGTGRAAGERVPRGTSAAGGQEKYNKDKYAALKERLDAIEYEEDEDGNRKKRVLDDSEKVAAAKIRSQMDAMLGIGGEAEHGEKSAPPPQQRLVYYRDSQGNLKSGNGYVVEGKVYDAEGKPIEGATVTSPKLERMRAAMAERGSVKKQLGTATSSAPVEKLEQDDFHKLAREANPLYEASPLFYDSIDRAMSKSGSAKQSGAAADASKKQGEPVPDAAGREKARRKNNADMIRDAQREERFQKFYQRYMMEDGRTYTISEEEARKKFAEEEKEEAGRQKERARTAQEMKRREEEMKRNGTAKRIMDSIRAEDYTD